MTNSAGLGREESIPDPISKAAKGSAKNYRPASVCEECRDGKKDGQGGEADCTLCTRSFTVLSA